MRRWFVPVLALAAVAGLAALAHGDVERASAGGPVVTNANDSGPGSLRDAIEAAAAGETISFAIDADTDPGCNAGTGVCTIKPQTVLPGLGVASLTLDGYTQDGATPNTAGPFQPTNARIRIVLDGSEVSPAGTGYGLWVGASAVTIRGLSIVNFAEEGIKTGTLINSAVIRGSYIGLLPDGQTAGPNHIGISLRSSNPGNVIGGNTPADRNVVSGNETDGIWVWNSESVFIANNFAGTNAAGTAAVPNGRHGIHLQGAPASTVGVSGSGAGNLASGNGASGIALTTGDAHNINVKGNRAGTTADGQSPLPNQHAGIFLDQSAYDNTIGGEFDVDEQNIIAYNAGPGVSLTAGAGVDNYIDPNETHSNGGLGADLKDDGLVEPNDEGDPDEGPNHLQNYPIVTQADYDGVTLTVRGTLNSEPGHFYNVFIFANEECDPSGYGEGERFIGTTAASEPGNGDGDVQLPARQFVVDLGDAKYITMSASNPESTSEFSACLEITFTNPTPTASASPTATPTPTPTPTATPTPTPTLTPSPSPTTPPQLKHGDVDCDDQITIGDVEDLFANAAGLDPGETPDGCPAIGDPAGTHTAGDLDCNGVIDGRDILLALIAVAGADPLPVPSGCPPVGQLA